MSPALLPLDCRGRLGGWPPLCRAAMGLSRTPRTCRGQTGPRHGFHQCGMKPTGSDTVSPDISTHDLYMLGTSFCLCAALLLVELMLTTASRLHAAPAARMLWPCLGGEASRALGVEKPADKEPSGHRFLQWVVRHLGWPYGGGVLSFSKEEFTRHKWCSMAW